MNLIIAKELLAFPDFRFRVNMDWQAPTDTKLDILVMLCGGRAGKEVVRGSGVSLEN